MRRLLVRDSAKVATLLLLALIAAPSGAYASSFQAPDNGSIRIDIQTASGPRQTTSDNIPKRLPTLAPDGKRLVYVGEQPSPNIRRQPDQELVLEIDTEPLRQITPKGYVPDRFERLEWLDESRIGAMECGHANCFYWIMDADSGETIQVMVGGFDFVWSHDHRWVARRLVAQRHDPPGDEFETLKLNETQIYPAPTDADMVAWAFGRSEASFSMLRPPNRKICLRENHQLRHRCRTFGSGGLSTAAVRAQKPGYCVHGLSGSHARYSHEHRRLLVADNSRDRGCGGIRAAEHLQPYEDMKYGRRLHRGAPLAFAAMLALLMFEPALAQDKPLKVEIVTAAPHLRDPIVVHVTNLTRKAMQLALPFYGRQTVASAPLDVETKKRLGWEEIPLTVSGPRKDSPQIEPGETKEYQFGVLGAGEYRVRVWYVVSLPDPGPPPRPAELRSVVSAPIRVR